MVGPAVVVPFMMLVILKTGVVPFHCNSREYPSRLVKIICLELGVLLSGFTQAETVTLSGSSSLVFQKLIVLFLEPSK